MPQRETIAALFELTIEAEKIMLSYYQGLIKKFSHVAEISEFWKSMADDELQHIHALEGLRSSLAQDVLSSPAEPGMLQKIREAFRFTSEEALGSVKTLEDAYEIANRLEDSETNRVTMLLNAKFVSSAEKKKFLMSLIETHLSDLAEFFKFGKAEWRRSIKALD